MAIRIPFTNIILPFPTPYSKESYDQLDIYKYSNIIWECEKQMKELRRVHVHVRNEDIEALIVKRKVECEKKRRRAEYKLFKLVDLDLFALITDNNYLISNSEDSSILADRTYNIPDNIKYEAFLESYGRGCLKSGRH